MILLFFAIVFLSPVPGVNGDPVIYDITLECEMETYWCAEIYIYELDNKYTHDPWVYGRVCTRDFNYTFKFDSMYPRGDGVVLQYEYEAKTVIYHNCTNRLHRAKEDIDEVPWPEIKMKMETLPNGTETGMTVKCNCEAPEEHKRIEVRLLTRISETYRLMHSELLGWWSQECNYPRAFRKDRLERPEFPYVGQKCEWTDSDYNNTEIYYWVLHDLEDRDP